MKAERLFRAIGLVDEDLTEAAAETPVKKRPVWRRYAAAVACLLDGALRGGSRLSGYRRLSRLWSQCGGQRDQ